MSFYLMTLGMKFTLTFYKLTYNGEGGLSVAENVYIAYKNGNFNLKKKKKNHK